MDISKKYIKMCEKAVEIQEKWDVAYFDIVFYGYSLGFSPKIGTLTTREKENNNIEVQIFHPAAVKGECNFITSDRRKMNKESFVWLPRQDQLQEMVECDDFTYFVSDFSEWVYQQKGFTYHMPGEQEGKLLNSMEQLWLAYVMAEKFNKVWNGENWVKEDAE